MDAGVGPQVALSTKCAAAPAVICCVLDCPKPELAAKITDSQSRENFINAPVASISLSSTNTGSGQECRRISKCSTQVNCLIRYSGPTSITVGQGFFLIAGGNWTWTVGL